MVTLNTGIGVQTIDGREYFGAFKYNEKSKTFDFIPRGQNLDLIEILTDIDDNEQFFKFKYLLNHKYETIIMPAAKFNKAGLLELTKIGVDVTENNVLLLINIIQQKRHYLLTRPKYRPEFVHKTLGWDEKDSAAIFKSNSVISKDNNIISEYTGEYDISCHGSYAAWKQMIHDHVLGHTPLETAVVLGLSATVNGYINQFISNENIIIDVTGDSSSGKTTMAMLALSTSASPKKSREKECLFSHWNATSNAIKELFKNNYGYPIVLDEFSMNTAGSVTDIIYSIGNGCFKNRLSKECKFIKNGGFCTALISTGESSMLNKTSRNTGILIRVISFKGIQWTESAEQSEAIKMCCIENYGWAISDVVKYIINSGKEKILAEYSEVRNDFIKALGENANEFSKRRSVNYSILLLTAKILISATGINFNYNEIFKFFIDNEAHSEKFEVTDIGSRAYDSLMEYIEKNKNKFTPSEYYSANVYGKICLDSHEVIIMKEEFQHIMKSLKYEDISSILKVWKKTGILTSYDSDRYTRKRCITTDGTAVSCYIIKYEKALKSPSISKRKIAKVIHKKPTIAELVAEVEKIDDFADF